MSNARTRAIVLAAAFVATLIAVYYAPQPSSDGVVQASVARQGSTTASDRSAARTEPQSRDAASSEGVLPLALRTGSDEVGSSLFAARSWETSAPKSSNPVPAPVQEALPQAPAPPIQLLGRYQEGDRVAVFATYNGDSVVLWPGEALGSEWRVAAIEPGQVVLTYVPLNQTVSLPWAAQ